MSAAWRAGAWPTPPWMTLPMITSSIVVAVDAGALDGGADGDGAELGRGQRREAAEELADRRAGGGDDDRLPGCIRHEGEGSKAGYVADVKAIDGGNPRDGPWARTVFRA